jgi:hypothetical protein
MAGNATKPDGISMGNIRPIGNGMAPPKTGGGTTPDGPKMANGNGNSATTPDGPGGMGQMTQGYGTSPSIAVPKGATRTVGHHVAMPGLTPTKIPGVSTPSYAQAGKTTATNGNYHKSADAGSGTTPNATQRQKVMTSGPKNPSRPVSGKGGKGKM